MRNQTLDIDPLISFLSKKYSLSSGDVKHITQHFRKRAIAKGKFFLQSGEHVESLGFVLKGIFRYFYCDEKGIETTKHFCSENSFLFNLASYIEEASSRFYIQSLEDSEILLTSLENFKELIQEHAVWSDIYVNFLEEYYVVKENREADFLLYPAKTRYSNFRKNHSDLEKRVPQRYIASFLGIAPESLSRIRRTLNKDQCEE